ncbi:MAG: hypothetical protein QF535_21740, partial [Anaerolineales bacterium]|nr:hypothetical protein [Anaerolineales bacterium]
MLDDGGWINSFVEIVGGPGVGQTRRIVATSTTSFIVDPPFDITPTTDSDFQIISNALYIAEYSGSATTTATTVSSIFVDEDAGVLYVGVDNTDNTGGVTAIGLDSDNILDIWHSQSGKTDDSGDIWSSDNIGAISAASSPLSSRSTVEGSNGFGALSDVLAITGTSTDAFLWIESAGKSLRDELAGLGGEHLVKTDLTIKQDLLVGESLTIFGSRVLGDSSEKPTFQVAIDGTVSVREDLILTGGTDLIDIEGINDVFVYDTTKDQDGGAWTNDTNAKSTSWYNEAIDATAKGCNTITHDRCGSRAFPQKAIIIGTTGALYIFDAKDNTMWMRFDEGSGNYMLDWNVDNNSSAIFALNGIIYVGGSVENYYLRPFDFIKDMGLQYYDGAASPYAFGKTLSYRNTDISGIAYSVGSWGEIIDDAINDIHAAVIDGKTYVAVATDGGVSVINETDETVVDLINTFSSNGYVFNTNVWLTSDGQVYHTSGTNTGNARYLYKQPIPAADDERDYNVTTHPTVYYSSDPWSGAGTAFASLPDDLNILDIHVTEGTSFVDGTSHTIYVARNGSLQKISDKQDDESNSAVKVYTQDYISEEMIGDIRGMWPFG